METNKSELNFISVGHGTSVDTKLQNCTNGYLPGRSEQFHRKTAEPITTLFVLM